MSDPIADYLRENAAYIEDSLAQHPEEAEAFAAHIRSLVASEPGPVAQHEGPTPRDCPECIRLHG